MAEIAPIQAPKTRLEFRSGIFYCIFVRLAGDDDMVRKQWPSWKKREAAQNRFCGRLRLFPPLGNTSIIASVATFFLPIAMMTPGFLQGQTQIPEAALTTQTLNSLEASNASIWRDGVGEGFRSGVQSFSFSAGAGAGIKMFGGSQAHDLALASLTYSYLFGPILENHWYAGNLELRAELFGGAEFSPASESLVGLTPHLRYSFATGTRWVPYLDGGAGLTATSIGPPDLSGTFQFNVQAAIGVLWFFRDNVALNLESRYIHLSNAGTKNPNLGVNTVLGMIGISWFF
jgi:lipid A 3-O-deacylase